LEEHIASIFRVKEIGSANQQASRWHAECRIRYFAELMSGQLHEVHNSSLVPAYPTFFGLKEGKTVIHPSGPVLIHWKYCIFVMCFKKHVL
jgi:hypothetical protein